MVVQPYHLGQHSPERMAMSMLVTHLLLPGADAPMIGCSADITCQQKKIMMPCHFSFVFFFSIISFSISEIIQEPFASTFLSAVKGRAFWHMTACE